MEHPENAAPESSQGLFTVDLREDLVKALKDSEKDFRILVDHLPICLMVHRGGKILFANPGLLRLLGYGAMEELVGESPLILAPTEDRDKIQNRINRLSQPGESHNPPAEQVLLKKNGEKLFAEAESLAVVHQGVPAAMVLFRDITQRKKTEDALQISEENFKAIVHYMPEGILIGIRERILFVNPALVGMLGYESPEDLIRCEPSRLIHPDYLDIVLKRVDRVFGKEGGTPLLEYPWVRKDGSPVFVEVSSISIQFEGQPALMSVLRDVSKRKKTEDALARSNENFRVIIQRMREGVAIFIEDRILFANDAIANMFGYDFPAEIEGRLVYDFIPPEFHSTARERFKGIFDEGVSNPVVAIPMVGKDGKRIEVESTSGPIEFDGKPAAMAVLRNMTTQNQIERQAALNEKLATVGTLAAGVAHEINNPLAYVLANLAFLREHLDELKAHTETRGDMDEKYRALFSDLQVETADIGEGGERIRDIVRGLKSFTRVSGDEVEKVDLNKTIELAVKLCLHEIKRKALLEKDFAPDLPVLEANSGKLQQVFINLLINSAQAMEGNASGENKIKIRTGADKDGVFAEFTDTGKGIPDKVISRIFEPFFTTKPIGVGTGLGLYICDEIIRNYQGTLKVQSREGVGTTFTVRLPAAKGTVESVSPPGTPFPAPSRGRVLVVDDEPGNLEVLKRIFRKTNEVLTALTGLDALAILEREGNRVDAIITDINMPDMNGVDFFKIVVEKFPGFEKRVVFITGGGGTPEMMDFLKGISNTCLEKPFDFEDLLQAVSRLGLSPKDES
jgi:two-component system cell cycle sensor histidine kinase/response regulator CckA